MSIYVFLGPSLPAAEARAIVAAELLPPVAMGDLYALVKSRARSGDLIGIVDGVFEQVPAVWHKEVLYALSRGVRVFGAASMGALRAAELSSFGMVGVGQIFEAYRSGELEDDDEVAIVHAPADRGYQPVSEAMVNVRWGLARAEAAGAIGPDTRAALVELAKARFYAERTWSWLYAAGAAQGLPTGELEALRRLVQTERPDAKRADALALLHRLAAEAAQPAAPPVPELVLEETTFWIGLTRSSAGAVKPAASSPEIPDAPPAAIVNHLRAMHPERAELWRSAVLLQLLAELGGSVAITRDELQATTLRFCRRRGITSHDGLDEWRARQQMTKQELSYLLELETRCDVLLRRHRGELDDYVLLELKRRGLFAEAAQIVADKWRNLNQLGVGKPTLADAGIDAADLQRWYEQRCGRMTQSPDKHVEELGFESLRDFVTELIALYMFENRARRAT